MADYDSPAPRGWWARQAQTRDQPGGLQSQYYESGHVVSMYLGPMDMQLPD